MLEPLRLDTAEPREPALLHTASAAPQERHHALDGLRAAAMFLGVCLHASDAFISGLPFPFAVRDVNQHIAFGLFGLLVHTFRMPLFFLVAGFFARLLHERLGPRGFVRHRFKRILVPFVVGMAVLTPLNHALSAHGSRVAGGAPLPGGGWQELLRQTVFGGELDWRAMYHLWFLHYLLLLYLLALPTAALSARLLPSAVLERIDGALRRLLHSWWSPLALAFLTLPSLYAMRHWGIDTPVRLIPEARILLLYALFFGLGWLLQRQPGLLPVLSRGAWGRVALACLVLLPAYVVLYLNAQRLQQGAGPSATLVQFAALLLYALMSWLLVFGATGLAWRYMSRPSAALRYAADSSYWSYLVHLPLVVYLQTLLARLAWPSGVKVLLILLVSTLLLLLSYHYLVRGTVIGRLLNGPRSPRPAPSR